MIATFTTNICDLEVEAEYEYDPGEPEVRYYRNGDGHPGSDPSATLLHLWLYNNANGNRIDLVDFVTGQQIEDIETDCLENVEDQCRNAAEDRAERQYEASHD